mgnify:CR=1 FL=1
MQPRVKSALIFVPLVLFITYLGGLVYQLFFLAVLLYGTWELHRLLKTMGYYVSLPVLLGGVGVLLLHRILFPNFSYIDVVLIAIILVNVLLALYRYEAGDAQAVLSFALHLSGIIYMGWMGAYFFSVQALPNGRWWALMVVILVWLVDLGAYLAGNRFGAHKLSPRLSPRKSWEGLAGGVVFGTIAGALLTVLFGRMMPSLQIWEGVLLGSGIALVTPIGDVFISMIKRVAGVKDSGTLIPGHGGMMDRIDTWLWAAMIGFYLAKVFS